MKYGPGFMQKFENRFTKGCHVDTEEDMRSLRFQDLSGLFMIFGTTILLGIISSCVEASRKIKTEPEKYHETETDTETEPGDTTDV
jgi:hypothetical protein